MDSSDPNAPSTRGVPAPFVNPSRGTSRRETPAHETADVASAVREPVADSGQRGSTLQLPQPQTFEQVDLPTFQATDRRRVRSDRRSGMQRRSAEGRRKPDLLAGAKAQNTRVLTSLLAAIGTAIALYAYLHAPIVRTPSPTCNEGFGGQSINHRTLSLAWVPAVALSFAAMIIPEKRRRPLALLLFAGATIGLLIAAILNVNSEIVGFCLD